MALRDMLISMMLMGLIVGGIGGFYVSLANQTKDPTIQSVTTNENIESFKLINQSVSVSKNLESGFADSLKNIPILGFAAAIAVQGISALNIMLTIPQYFIAIGSDIIGFFNLPAEVGSVIGALVTVVILFSLISAFLRWRV